MVRQSKMARPNAPRIAPTAMNTVPSGSVEWFMKGALWVGGTVGGGYSGISVSAVLETLGMFVGTTRREEEVVVVVVLPRPGSVGRGLDVVDDEDEDEDDEVSSVVVVCCSVVVVAGGGGGGGGGGALPVVAGSAVVVASLLSPLFPLFPPLFPPLLPPLLLLLLSSPCAMTRRARKVVRSSARFSER